MTARGPERRLHQPQARRGAGDRRSGHGHAPRAGHRGRPADRGRDEGRPRPADGRPDRSSSRSIARRSTPGDVVLAVQRRLGATTTGGCRRCATCRSTSGPARSSGSPRSPATARASWPRSITGLRPCTRRDPRRRRGRRRTARRGDVIARASPTSRRTGRGVGSAPNLSLTDNLIMKRYRDAPVARGWLLDDGAARTIATDAPARRYRIAAPIDRHAGPAAVRRQPPAG